MDPDQPTPTSDEAPVADVETTDVSTEVTDQPETTEPDAPETTDEESADGTSDEEAPEESEDSFTDVDLESLPEEVQNRYRQMQADYTRKTQELAEQRAELETQTAFVADLVAGEPTEEQVELQEAVFKALAERLGYDVEGDEDEGEDAEGADGTDGDEAPEFRDPRVDELLAEREAERQRQAQQEQEALIDATEEKIEDGLKELAKADGFDLSDEELDLLFDKVLALPPLEGEEGPEPDVKGAYEHLKKVLAVNQQRWIDSKRNAATAPEGGSPAGEPVDLMDPLQRQQQLARSAAAAMAQQNT